MWLECRILDTEVDGSNLSNCICVLEQDTLSALLQSTQLLNRVPGVDNHVKGVQCYELFKVLVHKNNAFLERRHILSCNLCGHAQM